MREIKFRAWDKKEKEMHLVITMELYFEGHNGVMVKTAAQKDIFPENLILMQYTGLKDKEGKEIYEGDVLETTKRKDAKENYKVEWSDYDNGWAAYHIDGFSKMQPFMFKECKIIGSIHENPELLK